MEASQAAHNTNAVRTLQENNDTSIIIFIKSLKDATGHALKGGSKFRRF